jgi:DNA-binding MarR family transcriptional regulator
MSEDPIALYFEFFNEIAIIEQLSRNVLEDRLPDGLIAPHFSVLNHLVRLGDGRAPIDIARAFQVPKTSMTHTLKVLERHRLITLRPNPGDGRSKLVYITEAGRTLRNETIRAMTPEFRAMAEAFDAEQLRAALPFLKAMRAYLDAARDGRAQDVRPNAPRPRAI